MSTTVTVRPNAVINGTSNDWVIFGGAGSQLAAINDNSDSTGIQSKTSGVTGGNNPRFEWGSVSFPGGAIISQVQFFTRYSTTGTNETDFDFDSNVVVASVFPQQYAEEAPPAPQVSIGNYAPVRALRPDGSSWVTGDFTANNISISVEQNFLFPAVAINVYDVWMVVTYDTPPSATVTAPTGNVLNPSPTVTWTYSDPDGDAQNAYQVRVFTSAQYGIGGFDPATSPNTWDSGIISSAGTSQVIGTALAAGDYRAYVKVSDATVGFGSWAFNSFTVVLVVLSGTGDLAATGLTQTEATASLSGVGNLIADGLVNNPSSGVIPSRCKCKRTVCDCFILDDGYDGLNITNNNTTTVRGIGTETRQYYVQNVHHPLFIPPAAKVRTLNASAAGVMQFIKFGIVDLNTDAIFNINQPDRFTITHQGVYMIGASIQWTGPPDLYTNFGIYFSAVNGFVGADPAAASPSILHNVQYRANKTNPGETLSRMSVSTFNAAYNIGDILRVGVFGASPSPNPGATQCSFWICYA